MKERTVSGRNLAGAFWGGLLGILGFGYLHSIALPVGCFLGVIVGWWYQEIWQSTVDGFHRGVDVWRRFTTFVLTVPGKLKAKLLQHVAFLYPVFLAIAWLVRGPATFIRWLCAHPMNREKTVRLVAIVTYWMLNAGWVTPIVLAYKGQIDYAHSIGKEADEVSLYPFMGLLLTLITGLMMPLMILDLREKVPPMRRFYCAWEKYAARGPLRVFLDHLVSMFRAHIAFLLFMAGVLVWFGSIGVLLTAFAVVPILAVVGIAKGVYEACTRAGHWLCLGTTVATAAISAWVTQPYLADARVLWIVALLTGLASAIATEVLRRALVQILDKKAMQGLIATPCTNRMAAIWELFMRLTDPLEKHILDKLRYEVFPAM